MAYPGSAGAFGRFSAKIALAFLLAAAPVQARIGDTPDQMSARMLQPDLGRIFTWPREMTPRERERQMRESPIGPFAHLLPTSAEDWREQIFWKSALRKQLSNEDGWRVHVYYLRGRSVLELYRRVGPSLNEFEVNAILARMRGQETWRRVAKDDNVDTIIGYDFELGAPGAESLRARRQGDWLLVFHKRLDDYLVARKARWDESEAQRRAEQEAEQKQTAPVSVDGF